jgi:hypothetical protein
LSGSGRAGGDGIWPVAADAVRTASKQPRVKLVKILMHPHSEGAQNSASI